jgi:HEAT repeat protein
LGEALQSESWQQRVEALKVIGQKRIEVGDFPGYKPLLRSPLIPERYWLVRALGVSRRSDTYEDLLTFLDDPHSNVVGIAFYALGQRGDPRAIKGIIKRIETSNHWYNQWHAYKALKTLGWKQSKKSHNS